MQRGFTLVEMLVAIAIMALMGSMSWVGLDVLVRSQRDIQSHGTHTAQLQIAWQQWALDLDQAWTPDGAQPMGWDGKVFRLTRSAAQIEQGVTVVAWAVRDGANGSHLMRWQSPPFISMQQWQQAWEQAANWGRSSGGSEGVALMPATGMDIFVWGGDSWVNAQSTSTEQTAPRSGWAARLARNASRDAQGVRLMISTMQGNLYKDWAALTLSKEKL